MNENLGKTKKGLSLAVLVISIIVSLILISISIVGVKNSIDNASIAAYANDLASIEEAVRNYYIENDEFPSIDSENVMSQEEVLALAGTGFQDELIANKDYVDIIANPTLVGAYYQIDLAKIDIDKSIRGTKASGQNNDVFVVSYPSMNIYYLKGNVIKKKAYYSLTSDLIKMSKIEVSKTDDTSVSTVQTSAGMTVKRLNKKWSNSLDLTVQTNISVGEKIYLAIPSKTLKEITPKGQTAFPAGDNTFTMGNLADIFNGKENVEIAGLLLADDTYLESLAQDVKYIEIVKCNSSGEELGRIKVKLSNYEKGVPTQVVGTTILESKENTNWIGFKVSDTVSGIKEVRYDYLTKYGDDGQIQNYYTGVTELDSNYLKTRGQKATVTKDGYIQIKVPKNIEGIQILVLDNAGNWTNITQPVYQATRTLGGSMYVGIVPKYVGDTMATFKTVVNNASGVNTIKTYLSLDGKTFANEKIYTPNSTNQITIIDVDEYTNITNKNGDFYLKIIATDSTSKTETIITSLKELKDNLELNTVKLGINSPVLSAGMTPIKWDNAGTLIPTTEDDVEWYDYENKKWANAQTADGSMWVWIPRYEYDIPTLNEHTSTAATINVNFIYGVNTATTKDYIIHPAFKFGDKELSGIWVAKFEASGTTSAIDSKPGITSLRSVNINDVYNSCRNMETNNRYGWGTTGDNIDTHLIKNLEWGACGYLSSSNYGINSEVWINPSSTYLTGQSGATVGSASTATTYVYNNLTYGINASSTGNVYGVYDMSGGAFEYTAAYINNGNAVLTTNGLSLVNAEEKYKDIYLVTTDTPAQNYQNTIVKKGDCIYETSTTESGATSWYTGLSAMPNIASPFLIRGSNISGAANASNFAFSIHTGAANATIGFRPVLVIDK